MLLAFTAIQTGVAPVDFPRGEKRVGDLVLSIGYPTSWALSAETTNRGTCL